MLLECARSVLQSEHRSCVKDGSPSLLVLVVSVGVMQHWTKGLSAEELRAQELWEKGGGHPGFSVPTSPRGLCGRKAILAKKSEVREIRSCVKHEVAVLDSPSLLFLAVGVDVKQHELKASELRSCVKDEVDVLGSPSLLVLVVSVDGKQYWQRRVQSERSGAVWKTRWPSLIPRPC